MGDKNLDRRLQAALLSIRLRSPFFATLSLFARYIPHEGIPTAATDGRDVFYNPAYIASLPRRHLDGLLLHEVLHAALLHPLRRGAREAVRWNIAADILVNGVVLGEMGMELPHGVIREPKLERYSAEEIYELIETCEHTLDDLDLLEPGEGIVGRLREIEAHWRYALAQAEASQRMQGQGNMPAGLARLLAIAAQRQIDWRTRLWRYLVRTPTDFQGFDRRFLHQRLYLDALESESLSVRVAIDTSGSISDGQLAAFLGELMAILEAYPHMELDLYYADAALDGPHRMCRGEMPAPPVGGGGTSFVPFFQAVIDGMNPLMPPVCVYLTDGYGTFPPDPEVPVLWVVTPGGLAEERFPFGEVARLIDCEVGASKPARRPLTS